MGKRKRMDCKWIPFLLLSILIWLGCGAITSLFQVGSVTYPWPLRNAVLQQELSPDEIFYTHGEEEPVGGEYRLYRNDGGGIQFPISEKANYIQVNIFISGPSNTNSKINWMDENGVLIKEEAIKLTSRLNFLKIPGGG